MNVQEVVEMRSVRLADDRKSVVIVDQTLLPNRLKYLALKTERDVYDAIKQLKVRGAPAIGISAAYGIAMLAGKRKTEDSGAFYEYFTGVKEFLASSRPTAVNLFWALGEMNRAAVENAGLPVPEQKEKLFEEAEAIFQEDAAVCKAIAEYGLALLKDGDGILTHCNAGPLATSRYGTALGPIFLGRERNVNFHVFADETRPLLQGARITSYELYRAGVDVTLICDNMASICMKQGKINAVLVGCDRVAANGDAANKIGTSGVAILAKHYGIPFYVLGPTSTIDLACSSGDDIVIEERDGEEIKTKFFSRPVALPEVKTFNPAFDVTDHSLISGIVTEYGVARAPFAESLTEIFVKKKGRFQG